MVEPKTYHCCYCGYSVTAKDATAVIDPNAIQQSIDDFLNSLADGISGTIGFITKQEETAKDAVIFDNTTLVPMMEQICEDTENFGKSIEDDIGIENYYERAVREHDQLQEEYNEDAEAAMQQHIYQHERQQPDPGGQQPPNPDGRNH